MAVVGRVIEIWRYPVKSMQGESLQRATIGELGVPGDRGWALRDENTLEIKGAKKFPGLMACKARYINEPDDNIPHVAITLPDGTTITSDAPELNTALSDYLGAAVTIHPRRPATDLTHYRRTVPLAEAELRDVLARIPEEKLPDLSIMPAHIIKEIIEYTSPRGTYFDAYPIHLLTTSWLAKLRQLNESSRFEVPRFRPNIVIDGAEVGFAELGWCGKALRVGDATIACDAPTIRCGMTTQATNDLPKDTQVLRTIVKDSDQNVGAYATVSVEGAFKIGDAVEVI